MPNSQIVIRDRCTTVTTGHISTVFAGCNDNAASQISLLHDRILQLEAEVEQLREAIDPAKAILDQMQAEAAAEAKEHKS